MKRFLIVLAACASTPSTPPTPPAHPADPHAHHQMHHRFEKAEDWVPVFDDPKRDAWQQPDKVVAALRLEPGMVVADVGAGTGYFEKRLANAVGDTGAVIAVDIEPDMVRYLRERAHREAMPTVEARQGAPDDPKLAPGTVDRVLIVDTWHHITDRLGYAKKLAAALKPGGFVLVVDFKLESDKGPPKQHKLAPSQVLDELARAGLRARVVELDLPDQYAIEASPSS